MSRVWLFGDDVNTDEIIPGRYNVTTDPDKLASHVFCEVYPELADTIQPGDVIVAGRNFGCGSSREHAPIAIKASGVEAVVAKSFARIFFRNAINIGLPVIEVPDLENVVDGAAIQVDLEDGTVEIDNSVYQSKPLPPFLMAIIDAGGIVNFLHERELVDLQ